jgi:hypothetical protein
VQIYLLDLLTPYNAVVFDALCVISFCSTNTIVPLKLKLLGLLSEGLPSVQSGVRQHNDFDCWTICLRFCCLPAHLYQRRTMGNTCASIVKDDTNGMPLVESLGSMHSAASTATSSSLTLDDNHTNDDQRQAPTTVLNPPCCCCAALPPHPCSP